MTALKKLDVNDPTIKNFVEMVHNGINRRFKSVEGEMDKKYIIESHLFMLMYNDRNASARVLAEQLNDRYNYNFTNDDIIDVLKFHRIDDPIVRRKLFAWAMESANNFVEALATKTSAACEKYLNNKGVNYGDSRFRVFCLTLNSKYPELCSREDFDKLLHFGSRYAKYVVLDMNKFLRDACGVQIEDKRRRYNSGNDEQRKIEQLENAYSQSDMMLRDLQADFDNQLEEIHQSEMIDFFSRLNSDRYGNILDAVIHLRDSVKRLRSVELPPEFRGFSILVENLVKFVRDNEINPIMKLGSIHAMKATDIESKSAEYIGVPFTNSEEVKTVKVISPGWYYKNKDILISPPQLHEYIEGE